MLDRYFIETEIAGDRAALVGPEAHHLTHVMRAKPGATVSLFDGTGVECVAEVTNVGRSEVELAVLERAEVDRELPFSLTLAVALPKGDRQKWLVEKVVELGVTTLVPLKTERGVAQPVAKALARLRRAVIAASKQCGRNRLMTIAEPRAWSDYAVETDKTACRRIAHPGKCEDVPDLPGRGTAEGRAPEVHLAIGPEGGFVDEEVALATAEGWEPIDLGPRILRIETAALLMVAMATLGLPEGPATT